MAQLWVQDSEGWGVLPLGSEPVFLTDDCETPVRKNAEDGSATELRPTGDEWVLLGTPHSTWVNGEPLDLGLRVLADRDEIVVPGGPRVFFSTERLAHVEPFAAREQPVFCARCRQAICEGDPAVICPRCGVAYHEIELVGLQCWTYGPCLACGLDSSLGAGFRWSPDSAEGR